MDFLGNANTVLIVVVACTVLCGLGIVMFMGLQIIGTVLGLFTGILEMVLGMIAGGPMAWCGCLAMLLGCGVCLALTLAIAGMLSTCGTPDAVNFCRIF